MIHGGSMELDKLTGLAMGKENWMKILKQD